MSKPTTDAAAMKAIIDALLAGGVTLRHVNDGEELVPVTTTTEAVTAVTAVDEASLHVTLPSGGTGWIFFVLGNDPEEVVCDHTVNLSEWIDPVVDPWWDLSA